MDVVDDLTKADLRHETVLTIGAFDGVHRGHQALIATVVDRARATGRLAAVVTFHPHPAMVLTPGRALCYLTTPGEKIALLETLGVDLVVLLPFNHEVAATPARDFMQAMARHLRLRELWVGADFALGRDREGDVPHLQELGRELGYEVRLIEPVGTGDDLVSSSRVRALLAAGCVADAARLLGRYPSLSGQVVVGARRGHGLGFPTANLEVRPGRAVPADGVYAVFALLGTERYPAVANVGVRPSFDNGQRTVETHILDFDQEIYGCDLVVEFVARLRDERRFDKIADLVTQIGQDSVTARHILASQGLAFHREPPAREIGGICPYRYYEVEHTADRALQVWGQALPDLFVGAARGMYSLMADLDRLVAVDWREVRLEAWDRETLLVDWLNELLFLTETEGLLFAEYRIETLTDAPAGAPAGGAARATMVARVGGIPAPITKAHIKAATFHNLSLARDEAAEDSRGWATLITFDV